MDPDFRRGDGVTLSQKSGAAIPRRELSGGTAA
jgi:hypothetical protein